MKFLFLALTFAFVLNASPARACMSYVDQYTYFHVHMPGHQVIEAKDGDVVAFNVSLFSNSAEYQGATIRTEYDAKVVSLVNGEREYRLPSVKPQSVDVKTLDFHVIGEGTTKIKVEVVAKNGNVLKSFEQEVKATLRPRYRCN